MAQGIPFDDTQVAAQLTQLIDNFVFAPTPQALAQIAAVTQVYLAARGFHATAEIKAATGRLEEALEKGLPVPGLTSLNPTPIPVWDQGGDADILGIDDSTIHPSIAERE